MLSRSYRLSEVNDAIDELEDGLAGRPVIDAALE
jgi:Zn-dependent alcohol dehydrogenase